MDDPAAVPGSGNHVSELRGKIQPVPPGSFRKDKPMHERERNFVLQQGLEDPGRDAHLRSEALLFQPRVIGLIGLAGIMLQSPAVFLGLAAVLWWCALLPHANPFDALYNLTPGSRPGGIHLGPAPSPRRFAQGMAGTFALAIGVGLLREWWIAAYVLEGFFAAAIVALIFGRFCLGSFTYHLLRGRADFARKTAPWAGR
jgi:hypothetical protein